MTKIEKSRSRRKIFVKVPGNSIKIHYKQKRPKSHKCAMCGKPLRGTPNYIPSRISKMAKTEKRPSRIFGGYICHECLKELLIEKAIEIK